MKNQQPIDQASCFNPYLQHFDAQSIIPDLNQIAIIQQLIVLEQYLSLKDKSFFKKIFSKKKPATHQHGIYLYGPVGRGKTMLLEAFFAQTKVTKKHKIHFHSFMLEVHQTIFNMRLKNPKLLNPISHFAEGFAKHYKLLCLDELQITDIADAMIVGKLFSELMARKVVIMVTSNRPPDDLYKNGLQREYFLEFIELIKTQLKVLELTSPDDYRLTKLISNQQKYHFPLTNNTHQAINHIIDELIDNASLTAVNLEVRGRKLVLPSTYKNIAICSFAELCEQPLGAADYLAICENFKILFLLDIPKLTKAERNEAKRFVTLIDVLYDHKIVLFCTAQTSPEAIYESGDGLFEFDRTVSRLIEMQSDDYPVKRI